MSVQVEKLEKNMAKLTIEVSAEELDKAIEKAYQKQKKSISIPGFRKGKVPRAMVEKMYGKEVFYEDAANEIIPSAYEKAYDEYKHVADKLGVTDPVLDKHIEKAYLAQLQESIDTLRANPEAYENAEAQIADLEKEYQSYKWRHTVQRAKLFVNDMQLQFDLGVLQFEHNMLDEAIATFTKVAENPQKRRHSLVYLARCELLKQQPAEAEAHLDEALQEMARMDKYKREALYYHGIALEKLGNKEKALDRYSLIHANMSNYRDVPQRIAVLNGDTAIEVHDPEN